MYLVLTDLIDKRVTYAGSKLYDKSKIIKYRVSFVPFVSGLEDMLFMLDYLMYAVLWFIRDYNNYVYRVGYSVDVLSVAYKQLSGRICSILQFFGKGLYISKRNLIWRIVHWIEHNSLTVFFIK